MGAWSTAGIPKTATVTKVDRGFPTQSLLNPERRVGLNVGCPLLSDLNLNWNVVENVSKISQCKILMKVHSIVVEVLGADTRIHRQYEHNRRLCETSVENAHAAGNRGRHVSARPY